MMHKSVLLKEVIEQMNIKSYGVYVDATFGRGGHAAAILHKLNAKGRLLAIDKDPEAIAAAQDLKDQRLLVKQGSFTQLQAWVSELNLVQRIDGVLLDLGISSPQLEDASRGFSFLKEGPLDMRMDPSQKISAETWINKARKEEIARVLKEYGEERFSRRIAGAIERERKIAPITTTKQLADIVSRANPKWERHKHPATRVFQAIRIYINDELNDLHSGLQQSLEVLALGGILAVISFHSLEDRIVKLFMRNNERLKIISRIIRPTKEEISENPRARSAVLRTAEKIT